MRSPLVRRCCAVLAIALAAGCGGIEGPTTPPVAPPKNLITLASDAGDWVGQGRTYGYGGADALLSVTATGSRLNVTVEGDERWTGTFYIPNSTTVVPGTWSATRYPFNGAGAGIDWSGEGRGCNTITGTFTVDAVTYSGSTLTAVTLRFEQHCEGGTTALRGNIQWRADDQTAPPGPQLPVPSTLWAPSPSALPASGNYVRLESQSGDYIGQGFTTNYTSGITVTTGGTGRLTVSAGGYTGTFQAMSSLSRVEAGYYPSLKRWPFHNPARGGLDWSGNGRGCNTLTGWFAVDRVTYSGTTVTGLDLRFEQHCEGGTPALHGVVHWNP